MASVRGGVRGFKHDSTHPAWDNCVQLLRCVVSLVAYPGGPDGQEASGVSSEVLVSSAACTSALALLGDLGLTEPMDQSALFGLEAAEAALLKARSKQAAELKVGECAFSLK